MVAAFVSSIGAVALAPSFSASAETVNFVTEITQTAYADSFTVSEGTLTAFTVPESVTGYFKVVIPSTVRTIAGEAFDGSVQAGVENKLTENFIAVDIPSTVEAILPDAFKNCSGILEVLNESSVTEVADTGLVGALSTVSSASDLSLATVSDAGGSYLVVRNGGASSEAYTLVDYAGEATAFTLPAPSVLNSNCKSYSVYRNAFKAEEFTSVSVPKGVTELGDSAFESCTSLTSLELPEGLLRIGANAFAEAGISSLTIPASVTEIRSSAFDSCTSLAAINFAERKAGITLRHSAFANCTALNTVTIPQGSTVNQEAFGGCTSLRYVYVGENTNFVNVANLGETAANVAFFSTNPQPLIIFSTKAAYDGAITKKDDSDTFKTKHKSASTYAVNVNCYVGAATEPTAVYRRLHGKAFNYVFDEETASWNVDSSFASLPVQAAHYSATVWYGEKELTNKVGYEKVNELLLASAQSEINLYCKETVALPALPSEPVSWVYDEKKSYDIADLKQVLEAMGCEQSFTDAQLAAMKFSVVFADEKGNVAETPKAIGTNGVYSVTLSLRDEFGSWSQQVSSTITVNVDTAGFNVVLIVFLVIGILAVIVTVSTAIIRKRVQKKNKKKQLSQKEALEKYRAAGGETTLK